MKNYDVEVGIEKLVKVGKIVLIGGLFVFNPLIGIAAGVLLSCFNVKKKKDD